MDTELHYCATCERPLAGGLDACPHCGAEPGSFGWPEDPLIGTIIDREYRVTRRLGGGPFGLAYVAEHVELQAQRSLRVLPSLMTRNPRAVRRFEREARALYRLSGQHIVRLEGLGNLPDGRPYMVLEFVDGDTLEELMQRAGVLSVRRAAGIMRQVAVALVDAEAQGILHRNLRPDNVLVRSHPTRGDEVKVTDFGLARILGEATISRAGMLSHMRGPQYIAPERWQSEGIMDARSDLFSLGVITFEMLAGACPWVLDGLKPLDALMRVAETPPLRLRQVRTDAFLPEGLGLLVDRLVSLEPARRPENARAVVAAIDALDILSTAALDPIGPDARESDDTAEVDAWGVENGDDDTTRPEIDREAPTALGVRRSSGKPTPAPNAGPKRWALPVLVIILVFVAAGLATVAIVGPHWLTGGGPGDPLVGGAPQGTGGASATRVAADSGGPSPSDLGAAFAQMVLVSGGRARLGQSETELANQSARFEPPADDYRFMAPREAELGSFVIDRREVSVADFFAWVQARDEPLPCPGARLPPRVELTPLEPIRNVAYEIAVAYCSDRGLRLPTYEEWEYAARARSATSLTWTDGLQAVGTYNAGRDDLALHQLDTDEADGYLGLAPVTALGANALGIEGLGGNVSEWVSGPFERQHRPPHFHRGGGYLSHPLFLYAYTYQFVDDACQGYPNVGLRCAGDAPPPRSR